MWVYEMYGIFQGAADKMLRIPMWVYEIVYPVACMHAQSGYESPCGFMRRSGSS